MPLAIEMSQYGPPSVLHPVERPPYRPGPGEALVRVVVAGVNRADCFIRSGEWPQAGGWPYVPGLEACGVVAELGSGVTGLAVGDRVITMMQRLGGIHGERPGGYQENVCVSAATLARVPLSLDVELAGALGLPAVTAAQALAVLAVEPGMRVLVQGGSSAVGAMALQLLRDLGAHAIGTGTREEKFAFMRACGAAETVSTRDPDWPTRIAPVDRVFDLVGKATFAGSVARLSPGGRLVFVGGTSGADLSFSGWDLMRSITLTGYSSENLTRSTLEHAMGAIAGAVSRGRLAVPELTRVPLAEAARAHTLLESGQVAGRVVLIP